MAYEACIIGECLSSIISLSSGVAWTTLEGTSLLYRIFIMIDRVAYCTIHGFMDLALFELMGSYFFSLDSRKKMLQKESTKGTKKR